MMADEEDIYEETVCLEEQGYVPTMVEVSEAIRTLNAARRLLSPNILRFAANQGRRICPMIYGGEILNPLMNEDWMEIILNAGDILNAAIKANPTMVVEWADDGTELTVIIA